MRPILLIATLLVIGLSACSVIKKEKQPVADVQINNIIWQVASFNGRALDRTKFNSNPPTIVFNMSDGKISGNDGCNNFIGVANYTDHKIKTGAIASTKMACPGNDIQKEFYDILSSPGLTYRFNNDLLRLYVNDAEVMTLTEKL